MRSAARVAGRLLDCSVCVQSRLLKWLQLDVLAWVPVLYKNVTHLPALRNWL